MHPLRLERRQVVHRPRRTAGVHAAHDGTPDRAAVERVRPILGQELVGPGQVGVPEVAVERRHVPVAQKHLARLGILLQHVDVETVVALPVAADPLRQPEPLPGGLDRRLQHLAERHPPEALLQPAPAVHRARHGGAVDAVERHRVQAVLVEEVHRVRRGRPAGGVQPVQAVILRRVVDRLHVAADAGALRLCQPEHGGARDRRVHGVPTLPQHLQAGLGRQRLARGDDAVARQHL